MAGPDTQGRQNHIMGGGGFYWSIDGGQEQSYQEELVVHMINPLTP